jgi:hypothetical protein
MRLRILLPLALTAVLVSPAFASDPPAIAGPRVPFRPRAWSPPPQAAAQVAQGMIEGDPVTLLDAFGQTRAEALSGITVEGRPDGSRHMVLGGAIRAWSVASVDECGQVQLSCTSSAAAAKARVHAAGARGGN